MSIATIKEYFALLEKGEDTLEEQYQLMVEQKEKLDIMLQKILESKDYVKKNIAVCSKNRNGNRMTTENGE